MELGNLLFGNSRGDHAVDRDLQDQWCEWMYKLGFDSYGHQNNSEGWEFENDTFRMQPYYWGDCDCGYEQLEYAWSEAHSHREACYQTEYRKINDEEPSWVGGKENPNRWAKVSALLEKHELPVTNAGSAVHCTCSYQEEWIAWRSQNDHKKDCSSIQPNFWFKPTGFMLDWYKYPLRDSYSTEPLTKELIDEMFAECERSMREG